jgi:hypothetical protein
MFDGDETSGPSAAEVLALRERPTCLRPMKYTSAMFKVIERMLHGTMA